MGNCVRRESSMVWAEDEWDSVAPGQKIILYDAGNNNHGQEQTINSEETHSLIGEDRDSSSGCNREVKIKIKKRELEELMAMQGLTMEELLAKLLNHDEEESHNVLLMEQDHHHKSWKPVLQSIPE